MTFLRWLAKFGGRIGKAVSSFSLIALGFALGVDFGDVSARLAAAPSPAAKVVILEGLAREPSLDPELKNALRDVLSKRSYAPPLPQVEQMIEVRAMTQRSASPPAKADAKTAAREIVDSPFYRDPGEQEQSNWFAKGFESIAEKLRQVLESRRPADINPPNVNPTGFLEGLRYVLWGILILGVGVFLYFAIRHFRWRAGLERKAKAILAGDEPVLSRDEYLEQVDTLLAEGRYREAVRALYLASLLLFDEHGVARFLKGQTNWEHLRRIHASASLPEGLDFEPATRKFDVVWYGMRVMGTSDVEAMRSWYAQIGASLRSKGA